MNNKLISRCAGVSLVELLFTLTIAGILMSFAVGNNSEVRQREKIASTSEALMHSIHYAQSYARHLSVTSALCAGTPADQCQTTDWTRGWTLFHSNQQNANAPLVAVRFFEQDTQGIALQLTGMQQPGKIIINGEGFISNLASAMATATICTKSQPFHHSLALYNAKIIETSDFKSSAISEQCSNAVL